MFMCKFFLEKLKVKTTYFEDQQSVVSATPRVSSERSFWIFFVTDCLHSL